MEDAYLRYGMILVGLALLVTLIAFAFKATDSIEIMEDQTEQYLNGESELLSLMVGELCLKCLDDSPANRDCYVIKADISGGSLQNTSFGNAITDVSINGPGRYIFKIQSQDRNCVVRQIG